MMPPLKQDEKTSLEKKEHYCYVQRDEGTFEASRNPPPTPLLPTPSRDPLILVPIMRHDFSTYFTFDNLVKPISMKHDPNSKYLGRARAPL
jgi:hypothetical protein